MHHELQNQALTNERPTESLRPVRVDSFLAKLDLVARRLRSHRADVAQGVAAAESRVLHLLAEHGLMTVPQLARWHGSSRQNIQVLVNRLHTEGYVELSKNPAHKSSELVGLTESGRTRKERAAEQQQRLENELQHLLSEAQMAGVIEVLNRVLHSLEHPDNVEVKAPRKRPAPRRARPTTQSLETPQVSEYGLPVNLL